MGVQIHIKVQDLLEDGRKVSITKDLGHTWDDVDDCNDWGSNKQKFKEAVLLDIPHISFLRNFNE